MRGSAPGERRGGRKKGVPNKKTQETVAAIAASGLTPMEFLLEVMRNAKEELPTRIDAAKAVAPYVHAKLAQIEHGNLNGKALLVKLVTSDQGLL